MNANDPYLPHIIALVSAAAGGFFGSASAFAFEAWRNSREEREKKYQELFKAQYIAISQHNSILNIKRLYLDPHRADPDRFMKLVPFYQTSTSLRVDMGSIAFVANEADAMLLHNIHLAELAFVNTIGTLELRNEKAFALSDDPKTKVESFDFATGLAQISADPRKIRVIKSLTDALYECTDHADATYASLVPEMRKTIKKLFPKKKAFQYET